MQYNLITQYLLRSIYTYAPYQTELSFSPWNVAVIIELFSNGKCKENFLITLYAHMPRSVRPKSVTTPRLKKIEMDRIRRNPQRYLRKMTSELELLLGSMQNLVKNYLHLKSFERSTVHFLSDEIMQKILVRSKGLLTRFTAG